MSSKFSYSKLDCYKQCHFMFKLKYIDGHYISATGIALEVGILIHSIEEDIANCIKDNKPIDYISLKNKIILAIPELEHKFYKDFWEKDKSGRYYKEKLYGYLTSGIYRLEKYMQEHPTYKIIGAEVPFNVNIEGKVFTGRIDRLLLDTETNTYICHDVKTFPIEVTKDDLATPLQFVVYTKAIEEMYKVSEDKVVCGYDLPFCNIIQQAGTKGFVHRGLTKIKTLFDQIDSQDWTPNPTALCHRCTYSATNPNQPKAAKGLCPYFSLWTKQNHTFEKAFKWQGIENHEAILEAFKKLQ